MRGVDRVDRRPEWRARVLRAKQRLDAQELYPRPVRIERLRVYVTPALFRLPGMRRFWGYAAWGVILLRTHDTGDALLTHELCHVWQMQHHPLRMPLTYLVASYRDNPWEEQARRAAGEPTRGGR